MKSGLEDRNNLWGRMVAMEDIYEVSMKSGLEDRNNRQATQLLREIPMWSQ